MGLTLSRLRSHWLDRSAVRAERPEDVTGGLGAAVEQRAEWAADRAYSALCVFHDGFRGRHGAQKFLTYQGGKRDRATTSAIPPRGCPPIVQGR